MSELEKVMQQLKNYVDGLKETGAAAVKEAPAAAADVGKFRGKFDPWVADDGLEQAGHISEYNGVVYVCDVDSYRFAHYTPDALVQTNYSIRPEPDADGVYPYVWGMAVMKGMLVRADGKIYECILETGERAYKLIYHPAEVPALFREIDAEG